MNTEQNSLSKYTGSFGLSLAISSLVNALLVVAKEKSPAVQAGMKKITGHHWITHAGIVVIAFIVFGWLFARLNGGKGPNMRAGSLIKTVVGGVVVASVVIAGFYLIWD